MELQFLGHSAFRLQTKDGLTILVDPFLSGNPAASAKPEDFESVDLVLVTHDHGDHLGDAFPLAKRTGATIAAIFELAMRAQREGIAAEPMSIGGSVQWGDIGLTMVNAQHGSQEGHAGGFMVETDSKCIYFAGDTALFGDMKLYGELWDIDVAVLPIGDRFTMGPKHAARAVEMLRPSHVVPCHFNTFSFIQIDPEVFVAEVGSSAQVHVLAPGETFRLD